MDGNSLQSMSPSQKDELMRTVQAQVALANMQEMLSVRSRMLQNGVLRRKISVQCT